MTLSHINGDWLFRGPTEGEGDWIAAPWKHTQSGENKTQEREDTSHKKESNNKKHFARAYGSEEYFIGHIREAKVNDYLFGHNW